jgi:hypothetical protein
MHLNIHIKGKTTIAVQMFDHLYAYSQQLNRHNNFTSEFEITFTEQKNIVPGAVNILLQYMPDSPITDLEDYDLVLLDNADEPLEVSTEIMRDLLQAYSHVYLIANTILDYQHPLYDRVIPTLYDGHNCNDYYRRPFYPQYYYNLNQTRREKNLVFVNGHNRAHRHHMMSLLMQHVPGLAIRSNITADISETLDCFYESAEDSQFRDWVNDQYPVIRNQHSTYYDDSVVCGIDQKFGSIAPGYFPIDEYFEYKCIIFPETSWINHQLCLTEKILKCFFAGALPFPISGAGIHSMYKDLGFYTAWNLLPAELQIFDQMTDHQERYMLTCRAIKYLHNNPLMFQSEKFKQYIDHNRLHMYTHRFSLHGIKTFIKILEKHSV